MLVVHAILLGLKCIAHFTITLVVLVYMQEIVYPSHIWLGTLPVIIMFYSHSLH
jgi:hypothetical protein